MKRRTSPKGPCAQTDGITRASEPPDGAACRARDRETGGRRIGGVPVLLPRMPASHVVLLLLGGAGRRLFNGVAGGGSLLSFPLLLGAGASPPSRPTSPTPSGSGRATWAVQPDSAGRSPTRHQIRLPPSRSGGRTGGLVGAAPAAHHVIGRLHPHRSLVGAGRRRPLRAPAGAAGGSEQGTRPSRTHSLLMATGVLAASVYGGYFGAAMGVMFLAVLGLRLPTPSNRSAPCAPCSQFW